MSKRFELMEGGDGKSLSIQGPESFVLDIEIDFDDVDHDEVDKQAFKLVDLLNKHWKK